MSLLVELFNGPNVDQCLTIVKKQIGKCQLRIKFNPCQTLFSYSRTALMLRFLALKRMPWKEGTGDGKKMSGRRERIC